MCVRRSVGAQEGRRGRPARPRWKTGQRWARRRCGDRLRGEGEEWKLRGDVGRAGGLQLQVRMLRDAAKLFFRVIRFTEPINRHATVALRTKLPDVRLVDQETTVSAPAVQRFIVEPVVTAGFTGDSDLQVLAVRSADAVTRQQRAVAVVRRFDAVPAAWSNIAREFHAGTAFRCGCDPDGTRALSRRARVGRASCVRAVRAEQTALRVPRG